MEGWRIRMKAKTNNTSVLTGGCLLMEADYEGKTSWRHFKVFLEMAPNLLSRVSTSVQGFHGVA